MDKEKNFIIIGLLALLIYQSGLMISTIHYMDQEITIQQTSKVIERIERIESCKCLGLTTEDIALIIRQQLVGALEFNYAIDGAMGEPTLVPLIKAMCEE